MSSHLQFMSRGPFLVLKTKQNKKYQCYSAAHTSKTNAKTSLTSLRCSSTLMCRMVIMKLKMLSMFWVSVSWMSLRRCDGNVWKVMTSSASLKRINITSSVCASCKKKISPEYNELNKWTRCWDRWRGPPHLLGDAIWKWIGPTCWYYLHANYYSIQTVC